MVQEVLASKVIHTDDTPVDVLDRKLHRDPHRAVLGVPGRRGHPYTVFTYTPSRSRDGPMQFLKGWGKDRPSICRPTPSAATTASTPARPAGR